MQQLHESLSRGGQTAITSKALYGLGGIGKTRVAVEYAWRYRDEYSALLFVVAETPEALQRNLATLAATLLPGLDTTDESARLQAVLGWLAANPGWFLILDNLDTRVALAEADALLAKLSGGHLVITSRRADFSAYFEPLHLDVLTIDDAVDFLLERTKGRRRSAKDDLEKARTIAVELDGLALMLEQAGAYIAKHRLMFDSYLERWRSAQHDSVLSWFDKDTATGYPRAVAVTWQTSVAQLTEPGRRLLERLVWLAPEKVPEFLLDVPVDDAEAERLHDALIDLAAYSLVTLDAEGPFFLVHRLVQDVTRRLLLNEDPQASLNAALKWIAAGFPQNSDDVRQWPKAEVLAPHARAVCTYADQAGITTPTSTLMNELGILLCSKDLNSDAELLYRRALALREQTDGPDAPSIATHLNNLAQVLQDTNREGEAEALMRRALAIDEANFGRDHSRVAIRLSNLAVLLKDLGRHAEAEPLMRRALEIDETTSGLDHPNVAIRLNNLVTLLHEARKYAEAEPMMVRALEIDEKCFGRDHPKVAIRLHNLAKLLKAPNAWARQSH